MKNILILSAFILTLNLAHAQEGVIEVSSSEQQEIGQELENEAQNPVHTKKTKVLLKKLSKFFKESPKKLVIGVKSLGDCVGDCTGKKKEQIVVTNLGRKLGRGSAWLTTATTKPFMNASGFLTGLFEKKDKNKEIIALHKFLLNHEEKFDDLYLEAGVPGELVELMLFQMEEIIESKSRIILGDVLKELGIDREIPESLTDFELTDEEIAKIDFSKVNSDLVNNHPEYAELRPILGDVSNEELHDIVTLGYFDNDIPFDNFKNALPKVREIVGAIAGQIIAPQIALGVVASSLTGLYAVPVVAANIGTGISVFVCSDAPTVERFETDDDLRSFCSYVINRSAYQLMKSRTKGYVAGKSVKEKLAEKLKKMKQRKADRKARK